MKMDTLDKVFPVLSHNQVAAALKKDSLAHDWDIIPRAQRALTLRQVVQHIRENRVFQDRNSLLVANMLESLLGAEEVGTSVEVEGT